MNNLSLNEQLTDIYRQIDEATLFLEQELAVQQGEEQQIRSAIEILEQQRNQVQARISQIQQERSAQTTTYHHAAYKAVLEALKQSTDSINQTCAAWEELDKQRQDLLEHDPDIEKKLQAYHKVESNKEEYFLSLPEILRPSMLEHLNKIVENLRQQLASYLELEERIQSLQRDRTTFLQIVFVQDPDEQVITCIVPPLANTALSVDDTRTIVQSLVETIQSALLDLMKDPDWTIDDMDTGFWSGYGFIKLFAAYSSSNPLHESIQQQLSTFLSEDKLFHQLSFDIHVAEITQAIWLLGEHPLPDAPVADAPVSEQDSGNIHPPLIEVSNGWYSDDDIHSWERPARTADGSLWNKDARRLRTFLIRMIGKGKYGKNPVPIDNLWECLPSPHREQLHHSIERLIEGNVLILTTEAEQQRMASLNPHMIGEIQNLIKRDVTNFWQAIIETEESVSFQAT